MNYKQFRQLTEVIVNCFEGGYYNPALDTKSGVSMMDGSGITMYGVDFGVNQGPRQTAFLERLRVIFGDDFLNPKALYDKANGRGPVVRQDYSAELLDYTAEIEWDQFLTYAAAKERNHQVTGIDPKSGSMALAISLSHVYGIWNGSYNLQVINVALSNHYVGKDIALEFRATLAMQEYRNNRSEAYLIPSNVVAQLDRRNSRKVKKYRTVGGIRRYVGEVRVGIGPTHQYLANLMRHIVEYNLTLDELVTLSYDGQAWMKIRDSVDFPKTLPINDDSDYSKVYDDDSEEARLTRPRVSTLTQPVVAGDRFRFGRTFLI